MILQCTKINRKPKPKPKRNLDVAALDFVEGVVIAKGARETTIGSQLTMKGAGYPFDGTFIITKVVHEFAFDGLRTEITFQVQLSPKAVTASRG